MATIKFIDVIGHLPECKGEDADAEGAYTQMYLSEAARLLGKDVIPETWVSLPPHRIPDSWKGIEDPVVPLLVNLYGHPLAGLLWEKGCEEKLMQLGWEHVTGWESLYVHRKDQLFMNVYVDDFHLAGKEDKVAPMWQKIRSTGIKLGETVPFDGNVLSLIHI